MNLQTENLEVLAVVLPLKQKAPARKLSVLSREERRAWRRRRTARAIRYALQTGA